MKFSKNVNNKKHAPKLIFFNEKKKLRKIRIIFDIENWLWKSEIGNFRSLDLEWVLIYQNFFFMKKCYLSLNWATIWCGSCWKILKWHLNCSTYTIISKVFQKWKITRQRIRMGGKPHPIYWQICFHWLKNPNFIQFLFIQLHI